MSRSATLRVFPAVVAAFEEERSPRGMVVGDLLWLLVIAFLFAIITGMVE
jgi:hypothetical protein